VKATDRKKMMTAVMAKLVKHFDLGLRYDGSQLRVEDISWLAEHQKDDANEIIDALLRIHERV
jgi:hypothetical protein